MLATLPLRPRHLAALAVVATAALTAACSDAPMAPVPAAAPLAARGNAGGPADIYNQLTATAEVRSSVTGALVGGATIVVKVDSAGLPPGTFWFTDNGEGDLDATPGRIKFKTRSGKWIMSRVSTAPEGHDIVTQMWNQGKISKNGSAELGAMQVRPRALLHVAFRDLQKQALPGAVIVIRGVNGIDFQTTIADGGAGDLTADGAAPGATDGMIHWRVLTPGDYQVCEQTPPTGYALANPACQTVTITPTMLSASLGFVHEGGILPPPPAM